MFIEAMRSLPLKFAVVRFCDHNDLDGSMRDRASLGNECVTARGPQAPSAAKPSNIFA